MPHALYHSEGLVLGSRHYGEADIVYQLLSPQLGLITALATGARYSKSKLRPHLRELDWARVTLVRGRDIWRLTAAEKGGRLDALLADPTKRAAWARMAALVRRLVRGEEPQPELYNDLLAGLERFGHDTQTPAEIYEQVMVLRLLAHLGYIALPAQLSPWLRAELWQEGSLDLAPGTSAEFLRLINHGLHHSQL